MKVRALKSDDKFLENMPQELMDELINLREPIPMRIRVMVMDYCPNFNRKRSDVIGEDEKLIKDTLHFDPSDTFIRFSSLKKKGIQEAWNAIYELCDLDFE